MIKIGLLARQDLCGLGIESREFAKHMNPHKILVIRGEHKNNPDDFKNFQNVTYTDGIPTHNEIDNFIRDIDVLFSFETMYCWGAIPMARQRGIKTVLRINYEFNINEVDENVPRPDLFIVPSEWNWDKITTYPKVYLPFPINREVLPFKKRSKIESFYHIAGHQMFEDRNGTQVLLDALPYIDKDIKIKIYSQHKLNFDTSPFKNVELIESDFDNYWDIHLDNDCLILPRRYGGQSLQLNEAISRGNIPLMPDVSPQEAFLPDDLLFDTSGHRIIETQGGRIECYNIDPQVLAKKINEMAKKDISALNEWCDEYADTISWTKLKEKYNKVFKEIYEQRQNTN
jgi:glycosyltransferase involved in cell wall biosynthesis